VVIDLLQRAVWLLLEIRLGLSFEMEEALSLPSFQRVKVARWKLRCS
jgi:hypothetical protein